MGKIKIVFLREYFLQLKKFSFWFGTLGIPLLMLVMMAFGITISSIFINNDDDKEEANLPRVVYLYEPLGLIDNQSLNQNEEEDISPFEMPEIWGDIQLPPAIKGNIEGLIRKAKEKGGKKPQFEYVRVDTSEEVRTAVNNEQCQAGFIFEEGYLEGGKVTMLMFDEEKSIEFRSSMLKGHIRTQLLKQQFPENQHGVVLNPFSNLDYEYIKVKEEVEPKEKKDPRTIINTYVLPILYLMAMMIAIMTSTDRLLRGMVEEKTNRVIEILLSSTSANQLMAGKVLGLGLVGLTQLAIWLLFMFVPLLIVVTFLDWSVMTFGVFLLYFLGGYLLLATCMLSFGSLGRDMQEAAQWSMVWIFLTMSPLFFISVVINSPTSTLAKVLSYIPFSSPLMVIMRLGMGKIEIWEIILSLIILYGSVALSIKLGAKLFRLGILMTGKAPNPLELFKMFRHAD